MAETSPDGRFRFVKGGSGGSGGTAYDTENGLLVGWNVLHLRDMAASERSSARRSIDLLKGLNHKHVLGVHSAWDAPSPAAGQEWQRHSPWQGGEGVEQGAATEGEGGGGRVVYLTTPCTTLEAFVETKVEFLRWRVVKRWCGQILEALAFLHRQSPPVVHKNLSLSSIYIDPSNSHIFLGGVQDIVAPQPPASQMPPIKPSSSAARGGSWGDRAWGLVAGVGSGSGAGGGWENASAAGAEDIEDAEAGAADVRAFGTVLVEMVLKKKLHPTLAQDERFLEMLPAISGWPSSVVDLLRLCRAPVDERPSALQLLEHPFLELENELDDEAIYSDEHLIAAAAAAAAAVAHEGGNGLVATAPTLLPEITHAPGPVMGATRAQLRSRRASPPPPLFVPLAARHGSSSGSIPITVAAAAAASGGGIGCPSSSSSYRTPTAATMPQHDPSCPSDGGGAGTGGWPSGCLWSPNYTPSCVSTESPSPSSPSAAPSFGGVPTTPSPPPARGFGYDPGAAAGQVFGGGVVYAGGDGFAGGDPRLPPGVTAAAFANATMIAARMGAGAPFGHNGKPFPVDGRGGGGYHGRRQHRSLPYSDRQSAMSAAVGLGVGSGGGGVPLGGDGGGGGGGGGGAGAGGGRPRSASEDAVWDMLPSDESQCRRPFSVSAVEGRHGY